MIARIPVYEFQLFGAAVRWQLCGLCLGVCVCVRERERERELAKRIRVNFY